MYLAALLSLLALHLPAFTSATCSSFVQTGSTFTSVPANQAQQVSNGTTCTVGLNRTDTNAGYGSCSTGYDASTNTSIKGCQISPSGTLHATGFNNLSLSASDTDAIYQLILNTPSFNASINAQGRLPANRYLSSDSGCINPNSFFQCMPANASGYLKLTPVLECVNGWLENCTNGPVDSHTPISICGVTVLTGREYNGVIDYVPQWEYGFVNTSAADAAARAVNTAGNATCVREYTSGADVLSKGPARVVLVCTVAILAAMMALI